MALSHPFEILDLRPGGRLITRVVAVEEGEIEILVRRTGERKTVSALRLHVPREDKATEPPYWDLTATRPLPTLRVLVPQAIAQRRWVQIVKHGVAPAATFEVALLLPEFRGPAVAEVAGAS